MSSRYGVQKMDYKAFTEELRTIIMPLVENEGLELVELSFVKTGNTSLIRLLVDKKEGGISVGDCARLNSKIGFVLETNETIKDRYIMEVSSPGLDRPLKTKNDFLRCIGRDVKFFFKEPINGKMEVEGEVRNANEDSVDIDINGVLLEIPLLSITKAKQKLEY